MEVNMRITYDPKYDLLYIKLGEAEKVLCKEVDEDITFDVDSEGKLVGIEILSASEHLKLGTLLPVEMEKGSLK
jgi:uncharacterized protein YuzE